MRTRVSFRHLVIFLFFLIASTLNAQIDDYHQNRIPSYKLSPFEYIPLSTKQSWIDQLLLLRNDQTINASHLKLELVEVIYKLLINTKFQPIFSELNFFLKVIDDSNFEVFSLQRYEEFKDSLEILQEIEKGIYPLEASLKYIQIALYLAPTSFWVNNLKLTEKEMDDLIKNAETISFNCPINPTNLGGDHPAYVVKSEESNLPLSIFKAKVNEEENFVSPSLENEIIGYELDRLIGFQVTPQTCPVSIFTSEGKKLGRLQKFIPNSKTGLSIFEDEKLSFELTMIEKHILHLVAISGFLKGIGAGHFSNYLIQFDHDKVNSIYEIDLEKINFPTNKTKDHNPMCRMWIVGLPAANLSIDIPLLKIIKHRAIPNRLELYHYLNQLLYPIYYSEKCLNSQKERISIMAKAATLALDNNQSITIRDLFFDLFNGKEKYLEAESKNYPYVVIFNEVLKYKDLNTLKIENSFPFGQYFKKSSKKMNIIKNLLKNGL